MTSIQRHGSSMCPDRSIHALIRQSEQEIQAWSGFSRSALLHSERPHISSHKPTSRSKRSHTKQKPRLQPLDTSAPPIPDRAPGHSLPAVDYRTRLKRRPSPRYLTLRDIRAKESEAALRSVYETGVSAYLNDAIQPYHSALSQHTAWTSSESEGDDSIKEEAEEESGDEAKYSAHLKPEADWCASPIEYRSLRGLAS